MKKLILKKSLNNTPPPPPPQCAVNEVLTSLFCLLAFLFLYACSSSEPTPTTPITTTHKVTFNPNTPSASSATVSNLPAEQNVKEGDLATKPAPTPPALTGYNFVAWYTEEAATKERSYKTSNFMAFGSHQTLCLTKSSVLRNRLIFIYLPLANT